MLGEHCTLKIISKKNKKYKEYLEIMKLSSDVSSVLKYRRLTLSDNSFAVNNLTASTASTPLHGQKVSLDRQKSNAKEMYVYPNIS